MNTINKIMMLVQTLDDSETKKALVSKLNILAVELREQTDDKELANNMLEVYQLREEKEFLMQTLNTINKLTNK